MTSGTFSAAGLTAFFFDDDALELFDVDEDDESLLLLELLLLDLDECVSPDDAFFAAGPLLRSSSSDFMQPLMSLLISRSVLEPSPSILLCLPLLLNFNERSIQSLDFCGFNRAQRHVSGDCTRQTSRFTIIHTCDVQRLSHFQVEMSINNKQLWNFCANFSFRRISLKFH